MFRPLLLVACLALALTAALWISWRDADGAVAHPASEPFEVGVADANATANERPSGAELELATHSPERGDAASESAESRTELHAAAGWVRGRVTFDGAAPAPSIELVATGVLGSRARVSAMTTGDGAFEFELEPGAWRVTCPSVRGWPAWREDVEVIADGAAELTFDYRGLEERVVSVWENNNDVLRPLEGAVVRLLCGPHEFADSAFDIDALDAPVVRTDATGRARAPATAERRGIIVVDAPGFVRTFVRDEPLSPEHLELQRRANGERAGETHVFLERDGSMIRGVVRGVDGRALSNAIVVLEGGGARDRRVLGDCDRLALAATGDRALPLATPWLPECARSDAAGRFTLAAPASALSRRQIVQLIAYPGRSEFAHHALLNLTPDKLASDSNVVIAVPRAQSMELQLRCDTCDAPNGWVSAYSMDGRPYSPELRLRVSVVGVAPLGLSTLAGASNGSLRNLIDAARNQAPTWPVIAGRARVSLPAGSVLLSFQDAERELYDPLAAFSATVQAPERLRGPLQVDLARDADSLARFESIDGGYRVRAPQR